MEFNYIDRTKKITDDEIINDVLYVKNILLKKDKITSREYFQFSKFGKKAITNHFGSWNNLLERANIEKTRKYKHLSKEEIFILIEEIWLKLKKQPTIREFEEFTPHTKKIILNNFGKWSICLKEFIKWEENRKSNFDSFDFTIKHKTPREPSKSLRYDVLKRDNFKCVICGKSPATNPNIELHIDHIIPYSCGGETIICNLQTLCSECNLGKSNKKD